MCVTKFKGTKLFRGVTALNLRNSEQFTNSPHFVGQMKEDVMFKVGGICIYFCSHASYQITEKQWNGKVRNKRRYWQYVSFSNCVGTLPPKKTVTLIWVICVIVRQSDNNI